MAPTFIPRSTRINTPFRNGVSTGRFQFGSYLPGRSTPSSTEDPSVADFSVDKLYSGDVGNQLKAGRDAFRLDMGKMIQAGADRNLSLLDKVKTAMDTNKSGYKNSLTNLLDAHGAALALGRDNYFNKAQGGIDHDMAAAAAELEQYAKDEQAGADLAVNSGIRDAKAMFSKTGGGGGSYGQRLLAGLKLKAATDLARNVGARRTANRASARQQQMALDAALFDQQHGDENAIYGDRNRFIDALGQIDRSDTNFLYGQEAAANDRRSAAELGLENDASHMDREDLRYLLDQQARYLPMRPAPAVLRSRSGGRIVGPDRGMYNYFD